MGISSILKIFHRHVTSIIQILPNPTTLLARITGLVEFSDEVVQAANRHSKLGRAYVTTAYWERALDDDDFFKMLKFTLASPAALTSAPNDISSSSTKEAPNNHFPIL